MGVEELAELVGILLGDGNIGIYHSNYHGRQKTQYRIKITLNSLNDRDYSQYVSDLLEKIFLQRPKLYKRKGKNALDVCLFGQKNLKRLMDNGLVLAPKWNRAIIPNKFLKSPLDKLVLRGSSIRMAAYVL